MENAFYNTIKVVEFLDPKLNEFSCLAERFSQIKHAHHPKGFRIVLLVHSHGGGRIIWSWECIPDRIIVVSALFCSTVNMWWIPLSFQGILPCERERIVVVGWFRTKPRAKWVLFLETKDVKTFKRNSLCYRSCPKTYFIRTLQVIVVAATGTTLNRDSVFQVG